MRALHGSFNHLADGRAPSASRANAAQSAVSIVHFLPNTCNRRMINLAMRFFLLQDGEYAKGRLMSLLSRADAPGQR